MAQRIDVMISSTARDLPEHREQAMNAVMRMGMHPLMMEHLPASDDDAIDASLKMVEEAEIYVGIFAFRYGYVPDSPKNPERLSVTEMELRRALERKIPCLIFLMDKEHPITAADMEEDTTEDDEVNRRKALLSSLKKRMQTGRVVNFFKSPDELRTHVIASLAPHRVSDPARTIHPPSDIPTPPEEYIAHRYSLLSTSDFIGRAAELNLLTDWITRPTTAIGQARILNIVAIGGMGKSALTWKWFNDIAPREGKWDGRLWWSFYESDAHYENFIIRSLAYVSKRPKEEITKLPPFERESQLLAILDREPFLLVLDGLERILIAYARMDAAHLTDSDYDQHTANFVAGAYGQPESAGEAFVGQHRLRKTADPRAGAFLKKLATVRSSRILVSTRLYLSELQTVLGSPIMGSFAIFLPGLGDDDALNLWRAFKADGVTMTGSRDVLLPIFKRFGSHPLVIRALAGEVANYKRKPGDVESWLRTHSDFERALLSKLRLDDAQAHVLDYALRGLTEAEKRVLHTIAAFRMPASYDTLAALLVEGVAPVVAADQDDADDFFEDEDDNKDAEPKTPPPPKPFATENDLDNVLTSLEDRGLVGWDRRTNRYDLHPITRGVTWNALDAVAKAGVYTTLETHFQAMPTVDQYAVNSLDDLTGAIELYNTLIGLGRYDDACDLFYARLQNATLYRLSASRHQAEMITALFPDGEDAAPRLNKASDQAWTLNSLAVAYQTGGQPGRAAPLYKRSNNIDELRGEISGVAVGLSNLAEALRLSGELNASEAAARRALGITREQHDEFQEAVSLYLLGFAQSSRGTDGIPALSRSLRIFMKWSNKQFEGVTNAYLARALLWRGEYTAASKYADRAWQLAHMRKFERDFIDAACRQGQAALGMGDLATADERLHHTLTRARAINYAQEELPALIALAELAQQRGNPDLAREHLDDVWELAERGPYPLFHADALNVLAQIERDAGNTQAAIEAATKAYTLAWCDGISADGKECYAYWWCLQAAKAHLDALGAPTPILPPFDPANFEPMPEVEIDPQDEYNTEGWVPYADEE
ncbi:MAG: DUF4062 domain-containing protein [Anaerolineae bacterium]|nr:DUF4062 domain-containing protein [Anaerolineae bacterium]